MGRRCKDVAGTSSAPAHIDSGRRALQVDRRRVAVPARQHGHGGRRLG